MILYEDIIHEHHSQLKSIEISNERPGKYKTNTASKRGSQNDTYSYRGTVAPFLAQGPCRD